MHGGLLEQLLLGPRQRVQTSGDDALHRLGQLPGRPAFGEHADVLLCEQRIAARSFEQRSLLVRTLKRLLQQLGDQPRRLIVGERLQRDRGRICLATAPPLTPLQQLRPSGSNDEKRNATEPIDEIVEKVQQAVVGPVQVLEHEDSWSALSDRLEEATPRGHGGFGTSAACAVAGYPDERAQLTGEPARLARLRNETCNGSVQLLLGVIRSVGLEDSRLRLDDLAERPECHTLAVGKAAA